MTSAVATLVGGACRSSTIGPTETGSALMLNDIWIWASTMMISGSQSELASAASAAGGAGTAPMGSTSVAIAPVAGEPVAVVAVVIDITFFSLCAARSLPRAAVEGPRRQQIHSKPLRQEPRDDLTLDAVAGGVEQRRERAQ